MGFIVKEITLLTACKDLGNIRYVGVFVQVGFDYTVVQLKCLHDQKLYPLGQDEISS